VEKEQRNLPAIQDLYGDIMKADEMNKLNILLNQPPKPEWVLTHPFIKGHKYLPINRVEYLLTRLFIRWRVEIKSTQLLANSIVVAVRLHYLDPISSEWEFQDGVGASALQTDSGAGAIDFNKMKPSAVMMSAPMAETFAIKDAAEKIGKLFGKDLNRKEEVAYDALGSFSGRSKADLKNKISELLQECQDDEFRTKIVNDLMDAEAIKTDTIEFYMQILSKLQGE
jgi:hypothetical protein